VGIKSYSVPRFGAEIVVDGRTYRVSVQIIQGEKAAEAVPIHSHAQFELMAFADGAVAMQLGDEPERILRAGDCCLIHPNIYHLRRQGGTNTRTYAVFIQQPVGTPLRSPAGSCTMLHSADAVMGYFAAMERELAQPMLGSDSNLRSLAGLILVAVLRELTGAEMAAPPSRQASVVRYEDIIDDFIALHYSEDLQIAELAELLGVTTRHLARIMQQSYGCTFRQRVLEMRLYQARKYLSGTDLPIGSIAALCGFTAEGAFSTAFRRSVGCTPSQYRRQKLDKAD